MTKEQILLLEDLIRAIIADAGPAGDVEDALRVIRIREELIKSFEGT